MINKYSNLRNLTERVYKKRIDEKFSNFWIAKYFIEDALITRTYADRLNRLIGRYNRLKESKFRPWYGERKHQDIFELIKRKFEDITVPCNKELLELIELVSQLHNLVGSLKKLSIDDQNNLLKMIKNNEKAQEKLNYLVENHLENTFNFDELQQYLTKAEKKNLLNV